MFTEEMLERMLSEKEMHTIPIGAQSTCLRVVEKVLEEFGYDFRRDADSYGNSQNGGK